MELLGYLDEWTFGREYCGDTSSGADKRVRGERICCDRSDAATMRHVRLLLIWCPPVRQLGRVGLTVVLRRVNGRKTLDCGG